jgi:cytoskeleton protein RodZ
MAMGDAELVEEEGLPVSVGERLREAREAAGLTLEDIATSTRIPTRHLESLEIGDFTRLPAPTYTVGFAKNYAAAVGLDRAEIGDQLRAEMGGMRPATSIPSEVFEPADPARAMPMGLIVGAVVAVLFAALLFNWLSNRSLEGPDEAATENEAAAVAAPAAPAAVQGQGPVLITANDTAWIEVKDGEVILKQGELAAGQGFEVPVNAVAPTLTTAKPEALRISVGTADAPAIGEAGKKVTVSLKPDDLLRRPAAAAAPPQPAAGAQASPPAPPPRRTSTASRPAASPPAAPAPATEPPANSSEPPPPQTQQQ